MSRLARYIECELDRHAFLFAQANGSLMSSCDFIDNVLRNKSITEFSEEEDRYLLRLRACYGRLKELTNQIKKEIYEYKEAYIELFADE